MIEVKIETLRPGYKIKTYKEKVRTFSKKNGQRKQKIMQKYSVAKQLNIMMDAILTGEMKDLQTMKDFISFAK